MDPFGAGQQEALSRGKEPKEYSTTLAASAVKRKIPAGGLASQGGTKGKDDHPTEDAAEKVKENQKDPTTPGGRHKRGLPSGERTRQKGGVCCCNIEIASGTTGRRKNGEQRGKDPRGQLRGEEGRENTAATGEVLKGTERANLLENSSPT